MTTPNAEYNALFDGLPAGALPAPGSPVRVDPGRSSRDWAAEVADRHGYQVELSGIGADGRSGLAARPRWRCSAR